jgi:hypothetical protein
MWFDFEVWQQEQAMGRAILPGRSLSLNFAKKLYNLYARRLSTGRSGHRSPGGGKMKVEVKRQVRI